MVLYHFTMPCFVRSILDRGLIAKPDWFYGMTLPDLPVVWLTEQRFREDRHYVSRHMGAGKGEAKWLPLSSVRIAVNLPRHLKPVHLVTLYRQNRSLAEKTLNVSFAERFLYGWWIYFGDIPRRYLHLDGKDLGVQPYPAVRRARPA
jgi:hypothetical protein